MSGTEDVRDRSDQLERIERLLRSIHWQLAFISIQLLFSLGAVLILGWRP
jgi:hypothetical protein